MNVFQFGLLFLYFYIIYIAAVQPSSVPKTTNAGHHEEINNEHVHQQYYSGEYGDGGGDFGYGYYDDDADDRYHRHVHQQQIDCASSPYAGAATTSEPGDYYDYGWDYETATAVGGSGQQTPSYQQQQQLDRQRRRGGRPVRRYAVQLYRVRNCF